MTTISSAPGKLMLLGDHSVVYGSNCIVTAVEQRLTVSVSSSDTKSFQLTAPEQGLSLYEKPLSQLTTGNVPKPVQFMEMALRNFMTTNPDISVDGIRAETKSEFASTFGFGSSSAVTVAFLHALHHHFQLPHAPRDIFSVAYKTVLDVQGVGSGFDVASACWGGTLHYGNAGKIAEPLPFAPPLMVVYSGIKSDTPTIVRQVAELRRQNPDMINPLLSQLGSLVDIGKATLVEQNWKAFGRIMNDAQRTLQQLGVSSEKLNNLCDAALKNGAWGAKLSGAGGGDCMLILAPRQKSHDALRTAVKSVGTVLDVGLHAEGVREETKI